LKILLKVKFNGLFWHSSFTLRFPRSHNRGGDFLLCAWPGHLGIAGAALATSFATWWAVIVIVACCQWDVIDGQYMSRFYMVLLDVIHLLHGYQRPPIVFLLGLRHFNHPN